jgi:hypothetical protein
LNHRVAFCHFFIFLPATYAVFCGGHNTCKTSLARLLHSVLYMLRHLPRAACFPLLHCISANLPQRLPLSAQPGRLAAATEIFYKGCFSPFLIAAG